MRSHFASLIVVYLGKTPSQLQGRGLVEIRLKQAIRIIKIRREAHVPIKDPAHNTLFFRNIPLSLGSISSIIVLLPVETTDSDAGDVLRTFMIAHSIEQQISKFPDGI